MQHIRSNGDLRLQQVSDPRPHVDHKLIINIKLPHTEQCTRSCYCELLLAHVRGRANDAPVSLWPWSRTPPDEGRKATMWVHPTQAFRADHARQDTRVKVVAVPSVFCRSVYVYVCTLQRFNGTATEICAAVTSRYNCYSRISSREDIFTVRVGDFDSEGVRSSIRVSDAQVV